MFYLFSLFFFGGMSIHLSTAMLAHLFSYDMYVFALTSRSVFLLKWEFVFSRTWGSTGKEVERSSFWIEGGLLLFGMHVVDI